MPNNACQKRTFSLSPEQGGYIDRLVKKGKYVSASEVVRAGLRALEERDAAIERWLQNEVVAAYDALEANPERAIPANEVFAAVADRHRRREARKA